MKSELERLQQIDMNCVIKEMNPVKMEKKERILVLKSHIEEFSKYVLGVCNSVTILLDRTIQIIGQPLLIKHKENGGVSQIDFLTEKCIWCIDEEWPL